MRSATYILACVLGGSGCVLADEVVWSTLDQSDYYTMGPSCYLPGFEDSELADDFFLEGQVTRVYWEGYAGGSPETYGAFVRFYEQTPEGEPAELLYEVFVDSDDAGFVYNPVAPGNLDITLPTPFEATGWHFVSVQVHNSFAYWQVNQANTGAALHTAVRWRKDRATDEFAPFKGEHGNQGVHNNDVTMQLWGVPAGPGKIDSLSGEALTRSGRIVVNGGGFGEDEANSQLLIDAIPAIVVSWQAAEIIGYVPEEASLGQVEVRVQTPHGDTEPVMLEVEPRMLEGNLRWRFAIESDYTLHNPGIGPNGEVYINDLQGRVYALTADGALLWIVDALQGQIGGACEGPVVVAEDGTIYVAVNPLGPTVQLVALNPDGSVKWTHTDPFAKTVAGGPAIGPEGDIYIAFENMVPTNQGMVRLTPEGQVVWMNQGQPYLYEYGGLGAEIFFGPTELNSDVIDQVLITVDHDTQRYIHAFDLESGSQRFAEPVFGLQDAGLQTQVHVGHDGKLIMPEFVAAGLGWGLQTFDPDDCSRIWRFDPGIASGMSNPKVGVDGSIYFNWDLLRTSKVSPDGQEIWRHVPNEGIHSRAVPSPNNDLLIVPGLPTYGVSGWIKALDVETGAQVFIETLEDENGGRKVPEGDAIFSHDGASAYVYVDILGDAPGAQYCYLYAVATGESGCAADVNGDGALNILDFVAFQNLFKAGDPGADCTGDGALNILDFVCYQAVFGAGCP